MEEKTNHNQIRIKKITSNSTYTCQVCGENFSTKNEFCIIPYYSPVCSSKCIFLLFYRIFATYEQKTLHIVAELLKIKKFNELSRNKLVFEVTKKYPKPTLSSINKIGSGSGSNKTGSKYEHKTGSGSNKPPIRGFEPESVEPKLRKWF